MRTNPFSQADSSTGTVIYGTVIYGSVDVHEIDVHEIDVYGIDGGIDIIIAFTKP